MADLPSAAAAGWAGLIATAPASLAAASAAAWGVFAALALSSLAVIGQSAAAKCPAVSAGVLKGDWAMAVGHGVWRRWGREGLQRAWLLAELGSSFLDLACPTCHQVLCFAHALAEQS